MSLRGRLLLAVGAASLVALLVADVVTYRELRSFLYSRVDQSLVQDQVSVERVIEGRGGGFPQGGPAGFNLDQPFIAAFDAVGQPVYESAARTRGGVEVLPRLPSTLLTKLATSSSSSAAAIVGVRQRFLTVGAATTGGPDFRISASIQPDGLQLIIGLPLNDAAETLHRLLAVELAVTLAALLAAGSLGWWLVRVGLAPLAAVEQTARAITAGDFDRRVPGDGANTEVGQLARALNTMLGRIADAFAARDATESDLRASEERLRRFIADASHELRTPLAAVAAYAELFERGAKEHPDDLARVLRGIRSETGRMGGLVEDLLLLARLDEGRPLADKPVELVALAAGAVEAAAAVHASAVHAASDPLEGWPVRLDAHEPVDVIGDEARLRQVLDNLLANVRAHTPPGTAATVRVRREDGEAVIEVADTGPGLRDDQQAQVFERFFRGETSRSRDHGGSGLGLAIVAAIVGAHHGAVSASNAPGGGAIFTVRLPLDPTPA